MHKLRTLWRNLNSSLWFVPTIMVIVALGLAYGLVILDLRIGHKWVSDYPLLFGAGADGARGVLTAIAGSMMTVAALIFSLTLSTLAQVSSQYTPRVLRNFMRSRTNQVVLGFFVSIFVYCLFVLRTIRGSDEGNFIPSLAVTGGLVLAVVSIGILVFFIHHMASSIQAANIVREVTRETERAIARLFPKQLGDDADDIGTGTQADNLVWVPVPATQNGYVQSVDTQGLLALARDLSGVVRMERGIGSFVARGAALVSVAHYTGGPLPLTRDLTDDLNEQFSLGSQRSVEQDVGFGLRQIVDIALKALSPGINDTTTSVICIDYLGTLLAQLAGSHFGSALRADDDGRVRVVALQPSFADYVATAFNQVRVSGEANVAVYLRLLAAIGTAAARIRATDRRLTLSLQVSYIREAADRTLATDYERSQVRVRATEVEALLADEKA
ncbi:DUF2254 domain-containing protein [Hymenobacter psoromatis]|uniref:DUF2254 domain-containing protein n=1 Tax=Hymenobacter psoromatis TaxID=1484116 RepID=UPI001CBE71A2|nr:DUF2254 domain-containing protein [Hymenobacter psoromatis]